MAPRPWKYAISEVTTMKNSFEEDVKLYAANGVPGIGVWGFKMEEIGWQKAKALLESHNLSVANCIPVGNSILPYVLSPEPAEPMARVEAFLPNMERMAKLNPESIVVITGPQGSYSTKQAWDICLQSFERIGSVARDLGVTIALEPLHRSQSEVFSFMWDIPKTIEMLNQLGQPNFRILFDTWHLWDTDNIFDQIRQHIDLIGGVHIADWKHDETRSWADRAFPGEGKVPIMQFVEALDAAGWQGHYDIEIFSDDGRWGNDFPDSLYNLPASKIVERATRLFR
ncbi:MAG: sugar phosphate isomerase/epimerase family protein [Aggregatilineales bacterium]